MIAKRLFDILISAIGLLVFALPIFLLIITIRISSSGSGLLRQERVGQKLKLFVCYKLRTMYVNAPTAATHELKADFVTGIGRWLRRLKLDELPQLWNVLRGDMSLVGPRPCLPTQFDLINERLRLDVFCVRPGITGKAQVFGVDMSDPQRLAKIDASYIRELTFRGDVSLILQTLGGRGRGDRVNNKNQ